ncbi:MAG: hypothetical protein ABIJ39_09790 [Chloroflexota bacterium]
MIQSYLVVRVTNQEGQIIRPAVRDVEVVLVYCVRDLPLRGRLPCGYDVAGGGCTSHPLANGAICQKCAIM